MNSPQTKFNWESHPCHGSVLGGKITSLTQKLHNCIDEYFKVNENYH